MRTWKKRGDNCPCEKRIMTALPPEDHRRLALVAALAGTSMYEWAKGVLLAAIAREYPKLVVRLKKEFDSKEAS